MNLYQKKIGIYIGLLLVGLVAGYFIAPTSNANVHEQGTHSKNQTWTCSMHPQIRQSEQGSCPLCGMDLIPLNTESNDDHPLDIKMSVTAMQLANVQTSVINMQKPEKEIRMNGKVSADERKVFSQSSHIPGRIEQLLVSYTGEQVTKGQVLAYIYSPELVTAQEELFEAYKIKDRHKELYQAARGKLMNWKLSEKQINAIIDSGAVQERFPVLADVSGVVVKKKIQFGDYVKKGQSLFEVADLSRVWVLFDVYEADISWVKKGNEVKFTVQSLPGKSFKGNITFIDPVINAKTRVAKVRVELNNVSGQLKPEMFVLGKVKSPISKQKEEIIVPKSAVMWTGERSVVYVKQSTSSGVSFRMRQITLGASLGDSYIIKEGLESGEEIATNGTFSIDAAAQLAGKPSMMNPEGAAVSTGHNHGAMSGGKANSSIKDHAKKVKVSASIKAILTPLFNQYIQLKDNLVNDDFESSTRSIKEFKDLFSKINMSSFKGEAHDVWMRHSVDAEKALKMMIEESNVDGIRKHFKILSNQMVMFANVFGPFDHPYYVQRCPMADNDQGADWLSRDKEVKNPYFGSSMLKCGEVTDSIK
jgi:membrane fusion protein, copper/silver efflux system